MKTHLHVTINKIKCNEQNGKGFITYLLEKNDFLKTDLKPYKTLLFQKSWQKTS